MNKVMAFLEKYVQWVALGVGVLWIGLMGWMYWSAPVAKVTLPGNEDKVYGPGDLDAAMVSGEGPVKQLTEAIANKSAPKKVAGATSTSVPSVSFVQEYQLAVAGQPGEAIPAMILGNKGGSLVGVATTGPATGDETRGTLVNVEGANILTPIAGVDSNGKPANGVAERTVVLIPDPKTVIDPMAPPPAAGAVTPIAPAVPPAPTEKEISWVTVSFNMDMQALAKTFANAHTPPAAMFTSFLAVEMVRQEQLPNGTWGPEVAIKPLANHILPPFPPKNQIGELTFLQWALKSGAEIIHPPFYERSAGALWRSITMAPPVDPNAAAVQPVANNQPFDPANPPTDRPLTVEEQGKVYQYKQKLKHDEAVRKAQEQKTAQPKPGAPPARPLNAPLMPEDQRISSNGSPILLAQVTPGRTSERPAPVRRPGSTATPSSPPPLAGSQPGILGDRPFAPPGAAAGQPGEMPEPAFNPATTKDVELFAHDDTVEPGKTYQYKVRLYIKNPLYQTRNMAANPKDVDIFSIKIESPWTGPITVPLQYFFFLAGPPNILPSKANVKVDYFSWNKGVWQIKSLVLQAGDAVGDTDWTVADLRKDPRSGDSHDRVMFVSNTGSQVTRTFNGDAKDADYKRLKDQAGKGVVPAVSSRAANEVPLR